MRIVYYCCNYFYLFIFGEGPSVPFPLFTLPIIWSFWTSSHKHFLQTGWSGILWLKILLPNDWNMEQLENKILILSKDSQTRKSVPCQLLYLMEKGCTIFNYSSTHILTAITSKQIDAIQKHNFHWRKSLSNDVLQNSLFHSHFHGQIFVQRQLGWKMFQLYVKMYYVINKSFCPRSLRLLAK